MTERELERAEIALEAHEREARRRRVGALGDGPGRQRIRARPQPDVVDDQGGGGRRAQPLDEPRLPDVELLGLDQRPDPRMHHLAVDQAAHGGVAGPRADHLVARSARAGAGVRRRRARPPGVPGAHGLGGGVGVLVPVDLVEPLAREGRVGAGLDGGPRVPHQLQVVVEVVNRQQPRAQRLAALHEVVQVGAGEAAAGGARASGVEGRVDIAVHAARDPHAPGGREGGALPRQASRQHAVEHVDPAPHRHQQVGRRADTHQVAGVSFG